MRTRANREIIVKFPAKTIISYDNQKIVIKRKGAMNFMTQGLKGEKTIPISSISSIQIKKPGLANGYIQFGITGGIESRGGINDAVKDENTIIFGTKKVYEQMVQLKQQIENVIYSMNSDQNALINNSVADEIFKLNQLLDLGIITQQEFEQQKHSLLNN